MPEISIFTFSVQEVTELLIKKQNIHEGFWRLRFTFATAGIDAPLSGSKEIVPAVLVMIPKLSLHKLDKAGLNALDAAKVNPKNSGKR